MKGQDLMISWIPSNLACYIILLVYELLHVLDRDIVMIFIYNMLRIILTFPFPWVCETCPLHSTFLLHIPFLFYICLCPPVLAQIRHLTSDSVDLAAIRTKETTQNFLLYGVERNSFPLQQILIHIYWLASLWMLWWACLSEKMTWSRLRSQYLWSQLGI